MPKKNSLRKRIKKAVPPVIFSLLGTFSASTPAKADELPLGLAVGASTEQLKIAPEPYMITTNINTVRRAAHAGLSVLQPEPRTGPKGFLSRLGYLSLNAGADMLLNALGHELAHYGELRNLGYEKAELGLFSSGGYSSAEPYRVNTKRDGTTIRHIFSKDPEFKEKTPAEGMAVAGRGMALNTLMSQAILQREAGLRYFSPIKGISYVLNHALPSHQIFRDASRGRRKIAFLPGGANSSDAAKYWYFSFVHYHLPFSFDDQRWRNFSGPELEKFLASLPADTERPPRGQDAFLYNYEKLEERVETEKHDAASLLGVGIFNALDPYTLVALYGIGKYAVANDLKQPLPPLYVPQFNGYLAFPGPQYELRWHLPLSHSFIEAHLRKGFSPASSWILGGEVKFRLPFTPLRIAMGGEGIQQTDNSVLPETVYGGVGKVKVEIPLGHTFSWGPYYFHKSGGVWTPEMFGLRQDQVIGVQAGINL